MKPLVLVMLLAALPTFAQQLPTAGETIEVNVVNVEAVVTDRSGNPVRGLTPADFEVRDNGVVQTITNFSEYADEVAPRGKATAPVPSDSSVAREPRNVLLFIERTTMPPYVLRNFFARIRTLLHETIDAGDRAAIVTWFWGHKIEQDFTDDRAKLDAALDRVSSKIAAVGLDGESELMWRAFLQDQVDEVAEERGAAPTPTAIYSGYDQARRALIDIRRKTFALNTMIDTLAGMRGRRMVLMATQRYSEYAGAEFFGGTVPPEYRQELNTLPLRESLAAHANAAGVTLYTLYPTGVVSTQAARVEEGMRRKIFEINKDRDSMQFARENLILINETAPLQHLAKQTGGISGWGPVDIDKITNAIRTDIGSYYSIGFRFTGDGATRAHNISVSMKKRGVNVRARREYVIKDDETRMKDTVLAALYRGGSALTLPFDVGIGTVTKKAGRRHIPVTLTILLSAPTGAFRIYGATGGELGATSDVFEKRQEFSNVKGQYLTYSFELVADGKANRIAIAVFDETSRDSGVLRLPLAR